ncbi:G-type lectin S-receptor-like serine/threonine-protein kinase SD1-13 isoform X2 [Ziziphus jujuba]|uniref:Receptor-like serine/threonine-protein kinase n=1 Tax=Ziziphus jujuba TaxID=326968 RepID=A0ABM3ZT59_ZIZJJ|nr:G-type lectin S-receptor-like serine/threonine-protein kinase SD1-13 isoform X2 [Ziziphus jujuba]
MRYLFESNVKTSKVFLLIHIFLCLICSLHALDTLKPGKRLHSDETLISAGGVFELGFFTPSKSNSEHLGIWFRNDRNQKPVWVALREISFIKSTGFLTIQYDGNLVISDILTVTNIVNSGALATSNETSAKILDTGNLILMERGKTIWQSFDYPTDTLLPGMSLGWFNMNTDRFRMRHLTSWLIPSNPNKGDYSLGIDPSNMTKFNVWRKDAYQQIGFWDGRVFRFFFQPLLANHYNISFESNTNDSYLTFNKAGSNILSWFVLESDGTIKEFNMVGEEISSVNHSLCDATLPRNSTGCLVLTPMTCKDEDYFTDIRGFLPNSMVVIWPASSGTGDCELMCRSNCSCVGYVFLVDDGTGCKLYYGNKDDLLKNIGRGNNTVFVRGDASKSDHQKKRNLLLIIIVPLTSLTLIILTKFLYTFPRIKGSPGGMEEVQTSLASQLRTSNDQNREGVFEFSINKDHELPLLSFSSVMAATDNFSLCNKIGEGAFGPVYKGKLQGHNIAVKRLSKHSRQGLTEFKNELQLLYRVQHRNLVKLLGCCIEQEEKILIYEYMANTSLDSFIFDPVKRSLLDWRKRKHIIEGIAQGLLYLHKYSRLRIVHRDLKTSNILLDNHMNPKISDFGLARILFENECQTKTMRVAGTYGYMSPEYAVHGLYSIKSDVFSFGVILLEIVSGRKNATFDVPNQSLNLLGYAWDTWNGGRCMELMDPSMDASCSVDDIMLCIQVGLLCVQESAGDRPTMSDVVSMFSNERMNLPKPKQPACYTILKPADGSISQNLVTISVVEAR